MMRILIMTMVVIAVGCSFSAHSYAACGGGPLVFFCDTNPPNPDLSGIQEAGNGNDLTVNIEEGAGINTQGQPGNLSAIVTSGGNDNIKLTGAEVRAEQIGIDSRGNNDNIMVINSILTAIERAIESGNQDDTILIENSVIESAKEIAVQTGNNDDIVTVGSGSVITSLVNDGIETANQDDMVTIGHSVVTGDLGFFAVDLGNGNDMLTIQTGAVLNGGIDCRDDFDTLIFAIEVPEEILTLLSIELASKNPAADNITINGINYEWEDCEVIENQLVGVRNIKPIPTLTEWGLIAMAGLLGIFGIAATRKRGSRALQKIK